MRGVPAMDISALRSLKNIHNVCKKRGITLVLSHVQEQPKSMMEKAGFAAEVGEENFCANIDAALAHAHVNVKMIDQGSSELNIIIGVRSHDFDAAINAVYDIFVNTIV